MFVKSFERVWSCRCSGCVHQIKPKYSCDHLKTVLSISHWTNWLVTSRFRRSNKSELLAAKPNCLVLFCRMKICHWQSSTIARTSWSSKHLFMQKPDSVTASDDRKESNCPNKSNVISKGYIHCSKKHSMGKPTMLGVVVPKPTSKGWVTNRRPVGDVQHTNPQIQHKGATCLIIAPERLDWVDQNCKTCETCQHNWAGDKWAGDWR